MLYRERNEWLADTKGSGYFLVTLDRDNVWSTHLRIIGMGTDCEYISECMTLLKLGEPSRHFFIIPREIYLMLPEVERIDVERDQNNAR